MVLHGVFYWSGTTKFQVTDWRPAMIKLSKVMTEALHFYSEDHTAEAVAFPRTGTRVALIRRGLLTTGNHAWDHQLTADGWAFLRSGQTMDEAHEMAAEINAEITRGIREGQSCLDNTEQRLTEQEVAERITEYVGRMDNSVAALEPSWSRASNVHAMRMIHAHAFWLGIYRAERDRRERLLAVNTYSAAVHNGLAQRGLLQETPLVEIHQAIQDLLHGEALEQFRAERPVNRCLCGSGLPSWECELLTEHPVDVVAELVADMDAAEDAGDTTPEGGVILRPIEQAAVEGKLSAPIDDQPLPLSWYSGLR